MTSGLTEQSKPYVGGLLILSISLFYSDCKSFKLSTITLGSCHLLFVFFLGIIITLELTEHKWISIREWITNAVSLPCFVKYISISIQNIKRCQLIFNQYCCLGSFTLKKNTPDFEAQWKRGSLLRFLVKLSVVNFRSIILCLYWFFLPCLSLALIASTSFLCLKPWQS